MRIDFKPFMWLVASLLLASLACGAFGQVPTETPAPLSPTETAIPTDTPIPPTAAVQPASGECTTLQDVNLRTGPGLAYRNPIGVVLAGSVVEPVGFVANGIPGGSWIMIEANGANPGGWITAGEAFLTCNIDLNSLPEVDVVSPPPPPLPKTAQTSDPEGGCGPDQDYQCDVIITDEAFLQFKIFQNGKELTENDNIEQVSFSVRQGGKDDNGPEVYSNVEETSAYCIFGGNGPCSPWPEENFVAYWEPGIAVTPGTYFIEILATVNEHGDEVDVRWAAEFSITPP
jgi:hypothetical protein